MVNAMIQSFKFLQNWRQVCQRLLFSLLLLVFALQCFAAPVNATGVYQMPNLAAGDPTWVIDQGEVLSLSTLGKINKQLSNLAKQTGNEVRFVTIHRLDYGETAASFTDQLFEKWFSTPEVAAHQTLYVLDTLTNMGAIHAGDGVKSLLTDDIAASVVNETIVKSLRDGDKYNEAFLAATDRLVAVLSGNPDPGAPQVAENVQVEGTFKTAEETDRGSATTVVVVLLLLATIIPMATYYYYQNTSN